MEPYCDSDEEVFIGPITLKEVKKILSLRRKTEVLNPLKTESNNEKNDESYESSRKSLYITQPPKEQVFRKRWNSCEEIEVCVTDGDHSLGMADPPPSPEHENYVGSPYPTPCRFHRQPFTRPAVEEELYPPQSTPKEIPPRFSEYIKFGDWKDSHAISTISALFSKISDNEDTKSHEILIAKMNDHEAKTQKLRNKRKEFDSSVEVLEEDISANNNSNNNNERTADSECESYEKQSHFISEQGFLRSQIFDSSTEVLEEDIPANNNNERTADLECESYEEQSHFISEEGFLRSQIFPSNLEVHNAIDGVTSLSNARRPLAEPYVELSGVYAVVVGNYLKSEAGEVDAMKLIGDEEYLMSEADETTVNEDEKHLTTMGVHKKTEDKSYISKIQTNETQAEEEKYLTDAERIPAEEFIIFPQSEADKTELSSDENRKCPLSKAADIAGDPVKLEADKQVKSGKNSAFLLSDTEQKIIENKWSQSWIVAAGWLLSILCKKQQF